MSPTKKKARKEPFGRPTKYDEKYCEMLVTHMAKGFSFESFAAVADVGPATIYVWLEKHENFREAKQIAFGKNRHFWEGVGIDGATGKLPNFNATAYIWNTKNRFPKEWNERRDQADDNNRIHTVKIELPSAQEQQVITMEPKKIEARDGSS